MNRRVFLLKFLHWLLTLIFFCLFQSEFIKINLHRLFSRSISNNESINVTDKRFGAIGDGVTDDTQAIQKAIDSLPNGGRVICPPGYTFMTNKLTISGSNITLLLNHCTLKTEGISITGTKSGIASDNGIIDGKLKVAKTKIETMSGGTVLTFDHHPFVVGDEIQSSYGIGGDGSNPVRVTDITATTVTVATPTTNMIPSDAYIGTYSWSATVNLLGDGSFVKGTRSKRLKIVNSKGYALVARGINITTYADNININKNGLDTIQVSSSATLNLSNSLLGFTYDVAKQGIVLGDGSINQSPIINLKNVTINRQNSDAEFFMHGTLVNAEIHAKDCTFIGTGSAHPSPYNGNAFAFVELNANESSTIKTININNCTFIDYEQGLITEPSGNTINQYVAEIDIKNCKGYNVVLGNQTHTSWEWFEINGCLFDGKNIKTNFVWWTSNGPSIIHMKNSVIMNDATTKIFSNYNIQDTIFEHAPFVLHESTYTEQITVIE